MSLPEVYIEREPLLTMLWAAVEVYNMECLGLLFGRPPSKRYPYWHISHAIVTQRVSRRTNSCVHASKRAWGRVYGFFEATGKLYGKAVGDFHSHPDLRGKEPKLGLSDIDMKDMPDPNVAFSAVNIIVRIVRRKRRVTRWRRLDRGTRLRGSLGKYTFDVNAYTVDIADDGVAHERKLIIDVAPSVRKALNRAALKSSRA